MFHIYLLACLTVCLPARMLFERAGPLLFDLVLDSKAYIKHLIQESGHCLLDKGRTYAWDEGGPVYVG
jgi:hypothetical protein